MREHHIGQSTTTFGNLNSDSHLPPRRGACTLATAGIVLALACLAIVTALPVQGEPAPAQRVGEPVAADIGPVADWIDTIIEILEDVAKELEGSDDEVEEASGGPLSDPARSRVATSLDVVETHIDELFSANHYPSLTPVDAGSVESNVSPQTLAEHADACRIAAQEALQEAVSGIGDDEVIGSKMKTIAYLLPAYRSLAGITE